MKRYINIIKILLFIIAFFFALYAFLDWAPIGRLAMSVAHNSLERQGMRLNYSDVTGEDGGFTVNNLTLSGAANISLSSVTMLLFARLILWAQASDSDKVLISGTEAFCLLQGARKLCLKIFAPMEILP